MDEKVKDPQKDFRRKLVQVVKSVGLDICENAEAYVGNADLLSRMTITISFDPEFDMLCPTINIDKDYLSKRAMDLLRDGFLVEGE